MRKVIVPGPNASAVQNSGDCLAAEQRVVELAVAPPGTAEEAEKAGLIDAVNTYRLKQDCPPTEGMENPITSLEQYEQARRRVAELSKYGENTAQAGELNRLMADIQAWDDSRPGATPRG